MNTQKINYALLIAVVFLTAIVGGFVGYEFGKINGVSMLETHLENLETQLVEQADEEFGPAAVLNKPSNFASEEDAEDESTYSAEAGGHLVLVFGDNNEITICCDTACDEPVSTTLALEDVSDDDEETFIITGGGGDDDDDDDNGDDNGGGDDDDDDDNGDDNGGGDDDDDDNGDDNGGGDDDDDDDNGDDNKGSKPEKVTILHATHSQKNPYVKITVSENAIKDDKGHDKHEGDVIPASDLDSDDDNNNSGGNKDKNKDKNKDN